MLTRYQIEQALYARRYVFIEYRDDMNDACGLVDLNDACDFIAKRPADKIRYIRRALEAETKLSKYVVDELRAMLAELVL